MQEKNRARDFNGGKNNPHLAPRDAHTVPRMDGAKAEIRLKQKGPLTVQRPRRRPYLIHAPVGVHPGHEDNSSR